MTSAHETRGRKPFIFSLNGKTVTLRELAELSGSPVPTLYERIVRKGLSVAEAVAFGGKRMPKETTKRYTLNGRTLTLSEWASVTGMTVKAIRDRMHVRGWTLEDALSIPKPAQRRRGVVSNLEPFEGTGAGSSACESTDITFHEEALSA